MHVSYWQELYADVHGVSKVSIENESRFHSLCLFVNVPVTTFPDLSFRRSVQTLSLNLGKYAP